jgi:hypothetical protein
MRANVIVAEVNELPVLSIQIDSSDTSSHSHPHSSARATSPRRHLSNPPTYIYADRRGECKLTREFILEICAGNSGLTLPVGDVRLRASGFRWVPFAVDAGSDLIDGRPTISYMQLFVPLAKKTVGLAGGCSLRLNMALACRVMWRDFGLGQFIYSLPTINRYEHPKLTETTIMSWGLGTSESPRNVNLSVGLSPALEPKPSFSLQSPRGLRVGATCVKWQGTIKTSDIGTFSASKRLAVGCAN